MSDEPMITRKPEFPDVRYEVYLDIESDPLRDTDYLLGMVVKDTHSAASAKASASPAEYKYFLAKDKSEEPKMWKDFLDFLVTLEDFVIYHYAYYERQVFDRLVLRYGAPTTLVNKFKENTIDLHLKVVESVVLPLYFYTLKDVAKYFGFNWSMSDAGGAESVVWFSEWLDKGDNDILKKILKYNEDDVRATLVIKEWLEKQRPKKKKENKMELPEG